MTAVALFDLDGTLIPGDSDHAFGEFVIQLGWADGEAFRRRNDAFFQDYLQGRLDIAAYVDFATSAWRGRSAAELDAVLQRFVAEVVRPMVQPQALELVQRHREAGEKLALVTATNEVVTRPIAQLFGIDTLIATDLARDDAGAFTGAIAGVPSFREGKVVRVQRWLQTQGLSLEGLQRSTFYSDSSNDLPLLERVSHPVVTNAGAALEAQARARGWRVIRLFDT